MVSPTAANPWKRMIAAIIDSIIVSIPAVITGFIFGFINSGLGTMVTAALILGLFGIRDALPIPQLDGASLGKKILGLKAVRSDGSPCDFETSFKRNLPLMIASVAGLIGGAIEFVSLAFLGAIVSFGGALLGLVVLIVELYKIFSDQNGLRIGDLFASSRVMEVSTSDSYSHNAPPAPGGHHESEAYHPPPPPPSGDSAGNPPPPPPPA